jgi:hypothetical protein
MVTPERPAVNRVSARSESHVCDLQGQVRTGFRTAETSPSLSSSPSVSRPGGPAIRVASSFAAGSSATPVCLSSYGRARREARREARRRSNHVYAELGASSVTSQARIDGTGPWPSRHPVSPPTQIDYRARLRIDPGRFARVSTRRVRSKRGRTTPGSTGRLARGRQAPEGCMGSGAFWNLYG